MLVIGLRDQISFELADRLQDGLLQVEIWCAGLHITYFDNHAHVPSFKYSMQHELGLLQTNPHKNNLPLLRFGPTTDDASCSVKIKGSAAYLEIQLANGKTGSCIIPLGDLLNTYAKVIAQLELTASA